MVVVVVVVVLASMYFTEGRTDLLREAIGPEGSNCFSKGGCTSMSKETYTNLCFSGLPPPTLLWIRPCLITLQEGAKQKKN